MKDFDIWVAVAEYVPAHPATYTRLAQVNRTFYQLFMSDKLWKRLDFYDVKNHISEHYLAKASVFTAQQRHDISTLHHGTCPHGLKACGPNVSLCGCGTVQQYNCRCGWRNPRHQTYGTCTFRSYARSSDFYLAYMTLSSESNQLDSTVVDVTSDRVRHALIHEFGLLQLGYPKDCSNTETVAAALRANPKSFKYASQELRSTPEVVCLALKLRPENYELVPAALKADPEIACIAIKLDSSIYKHVPAECQNIEQVYRAQLRSLRAGIDSFALA